MTSTFEKKLYAYIMEVVCNEPNFSDDDQYIGTLLLIALVCQKFDNYENEFTYAVMHHYTPEQLTLAKSRVDLMTDANKQLVAIITGKTVQVSLMFNQR